MIYDDAANEHLWVVVMAADHIRNSRGAPVQYATNNGDPSNLHLTLDRAARWSAPRRIVSVVASDHEPWWRNERRVFSGTTVFQPFDRGDAPDLMMAACSIANLDPLASILVMSAAEIIDHEDPFADAIHIALRALNERQGHIVLLGEKPRIDGPSRVWILPGRRDQSSLQTVAALRVPDDRSEALAFSRKGGVFATKMFAARVSSLLQLFEISLPHSMSVIRAFFDGARSSNRPQSADELYMVMPKRSATLDAFSRTPELLHLVTAHETSAERARHT